MKDSGKMEQVGAGTVNDRCLVNEKARKLYWERRNSHLCAKCGKTNATEKAYCPECSSKRNEYVRQNRIFYIEHGLCSVCGRNRVFQNERMCPECRAKDSIAQERLRLADGGKIKEKCSEKNKMQYWERVEQGICTKCGKNKNLTGKRKCQDCLKKQSEYMRRYYQTRRTGIARTEWPQYGLCQTCGRSLDMEGKKICSRCCEASKKI